MTDKKIAAPMPEPAAWPALVAETVLDTPEPDKWIDCGEARPLPMFHMHTLILYGEKCVESGITHGVKTASPAPMPEPVAWRWKERVNGVLDTDWYVTNVEPPDGVLIGAKEPLYAAPPAAPAPVVPMTDGQLDAMFEQAAIECQGGMGSVLSRFARAVLSAAPVVREPLTDDQVTEAFNRAMMLRPKGASNAETNRIFVRCVEHLHGIGGGGNG